MTLAELKQQCVTRNLVPVPAETLGAMVACCEAVRRSAEIGTASYEQEQALAQLDKELAQC